MNWFQTKYLKEKKDKLTKYRDLCIQGKMTAITVLQCYLSWRGVYNKFDSKRKIYALDCYFKDLYCLGFRDTNLYDLLHFYMQAEREKLNNYPVMKY